MKRNRTLRELFSFNGFKAANQLEGKFGDHKSRTITLTRQKKQHHVLVAVNNIELATIVKFAKRVIWMQLIIEFMFAMKDGVYFVLGARVCVSKN